MRADASRSRLNCVVKKSINAKIGRRFRRIITNSPDGNPPWVSNIEDGDDLGLFTPTSAPWIVHANLATLIGGIRALLIQALHPGSLAGVAEHSRYEEDPLGRLAGTTRWLTILTFGSTQAIERESARVNGMHRKVVGEYQNHHGQTRNYAASDPSLLLWVHIAFTESFLTTHELFADVAIPGGADAYVGEWSKAVVPLGLREAPKTKLELTQAMDGYLQRGELVVDQRTLRVVKFIKRPPLSKTALFFYGFLFRAAVISISKEYRDLLGLKPGPQRFTIALTRLLLKLMRLAIGNHSPLEEAALRRHARLETPKTDPSAQL